MAETLPESFRPIEQTCDGRQDYHGDNGPQPTRVGYVLALVSAAVMLGSAVPIVRWRNPDTGRPLPRLVAVTAAALAGASCYGIGSAVLWVFGIRVWKKATSASQPPVATGSGEGSGAESPQEVFDRAAAAVAWEDWRTLFHCIEPQEANLMLYSTWAWAIFATLTNKELEPRLTDMLARHRVSGNADAGGALAQVPDRAALFAELLAFSKQAPGNPAACPVHPEGTLHDLTNEGSHARGTFITGAGVREPVRFVQLGKRWYLTIGSKET